MIENLKPRLVVDALRQMIERAAGDQIRIEIEEPIGMVRLGKGQLEQVLMNLVLNACDAMTNGGRGSGR